MQSTLINRRLRREAFTLIEVMIVLFILMVLAGIGVVSVQQVMTQAKKREAKIFVDGLKGPLDRYFLDNGHYPTTSQGLDALINPPDDADTAKGDWPYIDQNAVKLDPWNQPYQYQYPGQRNQSSYDLWSFGPDGAPDTGDEIGNWK